MKLSYFIVFLFLYFEVHSINFNEKIKQQKQFFEGSYIVSEKKIRFINQNYFNITNENKFLNISSNYSVLNQTNLLKESKNLFFSIYRRC